MGSVYLQNSLSSMISVCPMSYGTVACFGFLLWKCLLVGPRKSAFSFAAPALWNKVWMALTCLFFCRTWFFFWVLAQNMGRTHTKLKFLIEVCESWSLLILFLLLFLLFHCPIFVFILFWTFIILCYPNFNSVFSSFCKIPQMVSKPIHGRKMTGTR